MAEGRGPLDALWREIDAAYAHVHATLPGSLACRAGCADCCVSGLTIGAEEVRVLATHLQGLDAAARARLLALVSRPEQSACLLLDEDMACSVYEARPTVCRVFGLPVRTHAEVGERRRLPLFAGPHPEARVVGTCHKNFVSDELEALPPAAVVDDRGLWAVRGPTIDGEPVLLLDAVRRLLFGG